jgi:uncharacterized membrane protein
MSGFPWRTLLFVSVALNLLAIGAVAGAFGAGVRLERQAPAGAVVDRMPGPRAFLAALPPETRAKMREELADSWVQSRQARQAAVQARREAFAAAATEPYDVARTREAFARLRAADQAAIAVFHDNVAEAFGELSAEERREALQALRRAAPAARRSAAPDAALPDAAPANGEAGRRPAWEERRERRRERLRQRRERNAAP